MTEIPEHLRKRAEAAKAKAEAKRAGGDGGDTAAADGGTPPAAAAAPSSQPSVVGGDRIPEHLFDRSKSSAASAGLQQITAPAGGGLATATVDPRPVASGPGGHTQRLLTVVKSGSIQDVKSLPQDKVHTWPHLLVAEFVAALLCTAFTFVFSVFVNAPLLTLANTNQTPNPSKAPWYFLGLQELLTMFHPMVAGVTIPGMGLILMTMAPFIDKNPSNKPEDRTFAISIWTIHLMAWAVLVLIGSFFRGPGFNFVFPWTAGLFFEL